MQSVGLISSSRELNLQEESAKLSKRSMNEKSNSSYGAPEISGSCSISQANERSLVQSCIKSSASNRQQPSAFSSFLPGAIEKQSRLSDHQGENGGRIKQSNSLMQKGNLQGKHILNQHQTSNAKT